MRPLVATTILLALFACGKSTEPVFYCTEAGTKYHLEKCRTIHGRSVLKRTLSECRAYGLDPCQVCHPETTVSNRSGKNSE